MINPFKEINWKPSKPEIRKTGKAMLLGFAAIAAVIFLLNKLGFTDITLNSIPLKWILSGGFSAGVLMVLLPSLGKPVYLIWFFVAACMGIVISNLVLSLVYYVIFGAMALAMKLFGRDKLNLRNSKKSTSWIACEPVKDIKRYFNQY